MKSDVLAALSGRFPARIPTKETLNHPGLISRVAGMDVFENTPAAYDAAWRKLSIDIHTPLPEGNAPRPRVPGGSWVEGNIRWSDFGVFPTGMPLELLPEIPKTDSDWIYRYDPKRDDFDLAAQTAELRRMNAAFRRHFGERAVMYHLYYTLLFMWPVVKFDWEPFLLNAALDPERFDRHFWEPWAAISRKHVQALCAMDEEVLFVHDDLAAGAGPVFAPEWFERYIFPRYDHILAPVRASGKKLVFVSDGNLDRFLERLLDFPFDGLMVESPATPFRRVLETWGRAGRGFIGGISTDLLTRGTPEEVRRHTRAVIEQGREYPGFILSACGGLPGNIPLKNILAYFRTRDEMGIPAAV